MTSPGFRRADKPARQRGCLFFGTGNDFQLHYRLEQIKLFRLRLTFACLDRRYQSLERQTQPLVESGIAKQWRQRIEIRFERLHV